MVHEQGQVNLGNSVFSGETREGIVREEWRTVEIKLRFEVHMYHQLLLHNKPLQNSDAFCCSFVLF